MAWRAHCRILCSGQNRSHIKKSQELTIEGMTCGHCVMHVKKELGRMPHVQVDDVQIGKARVQYDEGKVAMHDFAEAVERAGYKLVS